MKRVFLATKMVTRCGNSIPYDFAASAVLLKLEKEIGIFIINVLDIF